MKIKVSVGEIVDKYTILGIKLDNAIDPKQIKNIKKEYKYLKKKVKSLKINPTLVFQLQMINLDLWDIENSIRQHEAEQDFSEEFINLARAVYVTNDERAAIKKKINDLYSSKFVEEKILPEYGNTTNR